MRNSLRWIFLIPSMFLAWFVVLQLGFGALYLLGSLCAPDEYGHWICLDPWYTSVTPWVLYCWAGLSVFSVIPTAALVAPTHKRLITWLAFFVGISAGCYLVDDGPVVGQIVCVVIGGILGVAASIRWLAGRGSVSASCA